MKHLKRVVIFLVSVSSVNYADFAPSSGNGLAVHNIIQSGSGYLASSGESVLFTHPQTLEFALLGDANVDDATGTFLWTKTGANTASMAVKDALTGVSITYLVVFTNSDGGTFSASAPGVGTQAGRFDVRYMLHPSEVSTALAGGKPTIKIQNGAAEVSFSVKQSSNLTQWVSAPGTFQTTNGSVKFSMPVGADKKFFRIEMLGLE